MVIWLQTRIVFYLILVNAGDGHWYMHIKLTGNKKRATGLSAFDGMPLQNELNSDVARFTTHVRTCLVR